MAASRTGRVVKGTLVVLFTVIALALSATLVTKVYVDGAASGHLYADAAKVPATPVALVLGASVNPDGTPSPFLKARLDLAHELYAAGKVKVILVSGDNGTVHYNEPDNMVKYLVSVGVPAKKIVADYAGFDTYDSCVRAKKIFGVDTLTVVTQSYHLMRAVATCRAVGIDAQGVGDNAVATYTQDWTLGEFRELLANDKMAWDVLTNRQPTLGNRETSVDTALNS